MKRARVLCFALLLIFYCAVNAFALSPTVEEISPNSIHCGICEGAEAQNYGRSIPGKLGRGIVNIGLGWTNLFAQPIHAGHSGGNVLTGIGTGFWYTIVRTVQGVVEVGLFWIPSGPGGEALKHCALGDLGVTGR